MIVVIVDPLNGFSNGTFLLIAKKFRLLKKKEAEMNKMIKMDLLSNYHATPHHNPPPPTLYLAVPFNETRSNIRTLNAPSLDP